MANVTKRNVLFLSNEPSLNAHMFIFNFFSSVWICFMFLFCFVLLPFSFNFPSWCQFNFVSFNCWKFNFTYFSHNYDNYSMFRDVQECSGMFRNVPECSEMFRDVPCSWFFWFELHASLDTLKVRQLCSEGQPRSTRSRFPSRGVFGNRRLFQYGGLYFLLWICELPVVKLCWSTRQVRFLFTWHVRIMCRD